MKLARHFPVMRRSPCWHRRCSGWTAPHQGGRPMRGIGRRIAVPGRMLTMAVSIGTVLVHSAHAWAQDAPQAPKIDSGDTAWMLTSSALVLMMTAPGLALFYGGLVRTKNVLNLLAQSFVMVALISVQWVLWGYSLSFGPDIHGVV